MGLSTAIGSVSRQLALQEEVFSGILPTNLQRYIELDERDRICIPKRTGQQQLPLHPLGAVPPQDKSFQFDADFDSYVVMDSEPRYKQWGMSYHCISPHSPYYVYVV